MRIGDIVKPVSAPNGKSGLVRNVEGREVTVRWVLGSGWDHTVVHDIEELEAKERYERENFGLPFDGS